MKKLTITLLALSFFAINIATAQTEIKVPTKLELANKKMEKRKIIEAEKLLKSPIDMKVIEKRAVINKKCSERIELAPQGEILKVKKNNSEVEIKSIREPEKIKQIKEVPNDTK